jgi:signal transduction histidine kinase
MVTQITGNKMVEVEHEVVPVVEAGKGITERKKMQPETERAIQAALEHAENIVATVREPLVVLDKDLKVISVNRSFYQTFKVTPKETEGCCIYDLGNRQWDITELHKLLEEILSKTICFNNFEVEHDFPIIGHKTMLLNARRLYADEMILLAIEDITERRRLEEELVKSEKLAAIGQLASTVAHDIRNPLGVIKNSVYFLNMKLKDHADEKVIRHLKIMEQQVTSMNIIISDLLDFTRKKIPVLEQTDLNGIVTRALATLTVPENINVIVKLGEIPPMLLDPEQIQRVFQNIIQNAVEAMPEDGKLIIRTSKTDDSVEISIEDSGVGIPEENLPRLFTPFFSTKAKGVGLGLSVCKQLVEGHGGNVTVNSKVGEGTTFKVRLPICLEKNAIDAWCQLASRARYLK